MAKLKIEDLAKSRTINGHTFKMDEINGFYECRGEMCWDDEHDEIPEESLWQAGLKLEAELKSEGFNADLGHSEKGWVEVNIL
jgi:hypothetical protein